MNENFDTYSNYYDLIYKDKNYASESRYILNLLKERQVLLGNILEMGCGTGNYSSFFTDRGFSVLGIDSSRKMIEKANKRDFRGFKSDINFKVGDARNFKSNKKFDSVIALFHVASYMTSNQDINSFFKTASLNLRKGGVLIFDYWYGPGVLADPPIVRVKRVSGNEYNIVRIAEPTCHFEKNIVEVKFEISVSDDDSKVKVFREEHEMRYFFLPEIDYFLQEHGFVECNHFEWMSNQKLLGTPWYGVCVARKK